MKQFAIYDEQDNKIKEFSNDEEAKVFALNESKKRGITLVLKETATGDVIYSFGLLID